MIGKQCGNKICKEENFVQIILPHSTIFVSCFSGPLFLGHTVDFRYMQRQAQQCSTICSISKSHSLCRISMVKRSQEVCGFTKLEYPITYARGRFKGCTVLFLQKQGTTVKEHPGATSFLQKVVCNPTLIEHTWICPCMQ